MSRHQARKRFGQHFLTDDSVVEAIVRAIAPARGDRVVEIGPGLSALTQPLLRGLDHLTVVEIDRDLAARLRNAHAPGRLTVIEADALTVDFASLGERLRVVGNLPYNISSPLLFHLMAAADTVRDQHFMLQREVIDRMVAAPGSADYGRLSVMLQSRYRMDKLFDVPPEAFDPPPRVVSAVVRMVPLPADRLRPASEAALQAVVARAFAQRRKMLRRGLGDWAALVPWDALDIAPTARAEEISVEKFIRLTDALLQAGAVPA
ncbi:16S rRNA (adenine(1518)-N(6)/adenine(1519)-N(6))-dimethyltransferase RsmA [Bordetella petrii]|uniref:Ribosomal RNA small subunit methyltransferase A n=1 Tax=Bordetella petrii (strain ATCC BAA-461 / DSM 12804 / CCUG 43448 / CIP 107267 / Se-1111R) TaxID=340100 RepID=RSMA_BORPD|nr:16S rRNA (adenine(1518)-N(6)/adenine(1519)-N(6))-dimethyltransferase RsmA [Bordetella petrii]A9I5F2.1 RecName: Full=Ribosomal RNA small subunit methyltransferase A; AltName: Full=16S rRNA (adenine(1518)-N(6)/adenine(1519)-N(6))-dimethyltransferase; AltName: Full=16S rRNA dimethyladenosine transferase; AltName: Full=16S rRNA dimethylase; AltName: Full=S-adenosylmethionine-6-N', N'-adenosyl(rRNA) dimethyltransferase [Bordetella petrii DSM 12804]CAP41094.1 dimethyladenosine transferase [Bordetell